MLLYGAWIVNTVDHGLQIICKKRVYRSIFIDVCDVLWATSVAMGISKVLFKPVIESYLHNEEITTIM